jgi:hypothetical protein
LNILIALRVTDASGVVGNIVVINWREISLGWASMGVYCSSAEASLTAVVDWTDKVYMETWEEIWLLLVKEN